MITIYDEFRVVSRMLTVNRSSESELTAEVDSIRLPVGIHVSPQKHNLMIMNSSSGEIWYVLPKDRKSTIGLTQIYPYYNRTLSLSVKGKNRDFVFWQVVNDKDKFESQLLVSNNHYLMGPNRGAILACAFRDEPSTIVGCAFLDKMTYTNSTTNRSCFLGSKVEKSCEFSRGEFVSHYGISWASRFVVKKELQGGGIGRALAKQLQEMAAQFYCPVSNYIEVYTSEPSEKIEEYKKNKDEIGNFLTKSGYILKDDFAKYTRYYNGYDESGFKVPQSGRRLYYYCDVRSLQNRLFLPLKSGPYSWFAKREKEWEVRNHSSRYNQETAYLGRRVEARFGYKAEKEPLWGVITSVEEHTTVDSLLNSIDYSKILPEASSLSEAKKAFEEYVRIESDGSCKLIAFKIIFDE